jgi:hypothetical protein
MQNANVQAKTINNTAMKLIKNEEQKQLPAHRKDIEIKPYTLHELAIFYGISRPTMRKWLKPFEKEIGKRYGYKYTTKQVETILNIFLLPDELETIKKIA